MRRPRQQLWPRRDGAQQRRRRQRCIQRPGNARHRQICLILRRRCHHHPAQRVAVVESALSSRKAPSSTRRSVRNGVQARIRHSDLQLPTHASPLSHWPVPLILVTRSAAEVERKAQAKERAIQALRRMAQRNLATSFSTWREYSDHHRWQMGQMNKTLGRLQLPSRVTEVEVTTDGDGKRLCGRGERAGRHGHAKHSGAVWMSQRL